MIWKYLKQNVLFPKGLNWVQHRVSRMGLFFRERLQAVYSVHVNKQKHFFLVPLIVRWKKAKFLNKYCSWRDKNSSSRILRSIEECHYVGLMYRNQIT